jgi:hypothetical protein
MGKKKKKYVLVGGRTNELRLAERKERLSQKRNSNTVVVEGDGPPCHRCRQLTRIHSHREIGNKLLSQPFYYERWYVCLNSTCKTTLIMPDEFRVWRVPKTLSEEDKRLAAIRAQLSQP